MKQMKNKGKELEEDIEEENEYIYNEIGK